MLKRLPILLLTIQIYHYQSHTNISSIFFGFILHLLVLYLTVYFSRHSPFPVLLLLPMVTKPLVTVINTYLIHHYEETYLEIY